LKLPLKGNLFGKSKFQHKGLALVKIINTINRWNN
jgi:hypothetical protein